MLQYFIVFSGFCAIALVIVAAHRSVHKDPSERAKAKATPLLSHADTSKTTDQAAPPNA